MERDPFISLVNRIRSMIVYGLDKKNIRNKCISNHSDEEIFLAYAAAQILLEE